jgi:hypothetical protein
MQPGIKTTKLSTKEKLKTNMHSSNKPSGNSLKGNGIGVGSYVFCLKIFLSNLIFFFLYAALSEEGNS